MYRFDHLAGNVSSSSDGASTSNKSSRASMVVLMDPKMFACWESNFNQLAQP
jgi:hypothetical protein